MTAIEKHDQHQRVFRRDGYMCRYPGCTDQAVSLAHRIANTKTNRCIYGDAVIDDDLNVVSCCGSLAHNSAFNIGHNPEQARQLAESIRNRREEERGTGTCHK